MGILLPGKFKKSGLIAPGEIYRLSGLNLGQG